MNKINHLYIHVPFCKSICNYCDFCHRIYDSNTVTKWLNTLEKEIKDKCHNSYETIYLGGGTPTCLDYDELDKLLSLIEPYSINTKEYTIEVNPETLDLNKINILKKYHINRISMGVQSSNDEILLFLNRKHKFTDIKEKIKLLKDNGLNNISIDLMYSLPNQTMDILKQTLDDFIKLDVPHVSLYSLTIEENTVFGKRNIKPLDIDTEADMYELIEKTLIKNNYIHYEVSNFCKQNYESKHNMGYWNYDNFLGLSLGASSKIDNIRYTNTFNFNDYFKDFNAKSEYIELSIEDQKFENIMMSLRTNIGLNIEEFNRRYNADLLKEYTKGINNPNIKIDNGYLKCTNLEILNNVLLDFMIY